MEKDLNSYSDLNAYDTNEEISIKDKIQQFNTVLTTLNTEDQTFIKTKLTTLFTALKSIKVLTEMFNEYYWDILDGDDRERIAEFTSESIVYLPLIYKYDFEHGIADNFNQMMHHILIKYYGNMYANFDLTNLKNLLNDEFDQFTEHAKLELTQIKQDVLNVFNNDVSLNDLIKISNILSNNGLNYDFFLNCIIMDRGPYVLYNETDMYNKLSANFQYSNLHSFLTMVNNINIHCKISKDFDYSNDLNKDSALFISDQTIKRYWNITYFDFENDFINALSNEW